MISQPNRRRRSPQSRTPVLDDAPLTLAEEHALLLCQVAARIEDLLTAAEERWPRHELRALVGYLRTEVMRQALDEEWLLFPNRSVPPGLDELHRDHQSLRHCTETLAQAASGAPGWTAGRLAVTTQDLLTLLEGHLAAEETVLTRGDASRALPATAVLTGRSHEWYPLTEGAVIDIDALPADQAGDAVVERLLRLRTGGQVELRSSDDNLQAVWRRMDHVDPGRYGFAYLREGPQQWAMRITRRPST